MMWWRVRSRAATAARTATVLPAPTSPVMTPRAASATQKLMRATASAWVSRANRSRAAMALVRGVRVNPKWATQGAGGLGDLRVGVVADGEWGGDPGGGALDEHRQPGEVLWVVAQLDPAADQRRVDLVAVAGQRHGRGLGHHPRR